MGDEPVPNFDPSLPRGPQTASLHYLLRGNSRPGDLSGGNRPSARREARVSLCESDHWDEEEGDGSLDLGELHARSVKTIVNGPVNLGYTLRRADRGLSSRKSSSRILGEPAPPAL
ncbi:hypothetical protein GJ744_008710 [Endocarpon pusillum]|uniref:Uncharacterized protein n=1 Tax=Endocarpon pusillum TaxID=364733 RepID=A0A8H7AGS3_9EURO|nr:hypothetical protein GJ744_008710 [Endocarpon pusillum]